LTSNEDEEFAGLVKRQSHFVFRVAYAILRNSHDAEDAVQETFLKLYRSQAWQKIEDERAFLARVAWRMAADRLPKKQPAYAEPESEPLSTGAYPRAGGHRRQPARLRSLHDRCTPRRTSSAAGPLRHR
jgi:RNA polymerase sigma-70 factor (ECF subfamily)